MQTRWRRIATWGLLFGLVIAGVVFALWPRPVLVDLAVVERGRLMVTADEEGETRVRDVFVVSSPIRGRVLRIEHEVGDEVFAGGTLLTQIESIDPAFLDFRSETEAKAAIRVADAAKALSEAKLIEANAELEFARTELDRARQLIRTDAISKRALDDATRKFKTRTAAVATATAALDMRNFEVAKARAHLVSPAQRQALRKGCDCVPIVAPVSGRILRLLRESEGVVQDGEALMEIGDPANLEIVADFLTSDAVEMVQGQRVVIEHWGGDTPLAGRVRRVEPYGFTKVSALGIEEQRVNVVIDFTDPSERRQRLAHGFRVEIRVVLWEGDQVMKLPLTAFFRKKNGWQVFVEEDGRARRRPVRLGRSNGIHREIADGLKEGDRVVLHPSNQITEGVTIEDRT